MIPASVFRDGKKMVDIFVCECQRAILLKHIEMKLIRKPNMEASEWNVSIQPKVRANWANTARSHLKQFDGTHYAIQILARAQITRGVDKHGHLV